MSRVFKHVVMTRFNLVLDLPWPQKTSKERETWLLDRLEKFKPCLESMKQQTNQNFEWLIYLDETTSPKIRKLLENLLKKNKNFRTVYVKKTGPLVSVLFYNVQKDFVEQIKPLPEYLITTRLDSDDAVLPQFIDTIQKNFIKKHNYAINLTRGFIGNNKKQKQIIYPSNPFISLIEKTNQEIRTIYHWHHPDVRFKVPTKQIMDNPYWIQIIHEGNVGNHIKKMHKYMHFFLTIITNTNTKKTVKKILNNQIK